MLWRKTLGVIRRTRAIFLCPNLQHPLRLLNSAFMQDWVAAKRQLDHQSALCRSSCLGPAQKRPKFANMPLELTADCRLLGSDGGCGQPNPLMSGMSYFPHPQGYLQMPQMPCNVPRMLTVEGLNGVTQFPQPFQLAPVYFVAQPTSQAFHEVKQQGNVVSPPTQEQKKAEKQYEAPRDCSDESASSKVSSLTM